MNNKNYEEIAKAINKSIIRYHKCEGWDIKDYPYVIALELSKYFKKDNVNFDKKKFLDKINA